MTTVVAEILERARALPPEERAELAREVLALLDEGEDDPERVEKEWAAEIERRVERVISGESEGRPWSDVRERAAELLRRR